MFCSQCGSKLIEGSVFCSECGARVKAADAGTDEKILDIPAAEQKQQTDGTPSGEAQVRDAAVQQSKINEPVRAAKEQTHGAHENAPRKGKKLPVILGVAVFGVIAVIIIVLNWGGKTDYVASVKAHTPFAASQGLPYTYEEVLDRYIVSPKWELNEEEDIHYVNISGKVKGTDSSLAIAIAVSPNPNNPDKILMKPESIAVDGEELFLQGDAVDFLAAMFFMYDEGYEDLSWWNTDPSLSSAEPDLDYVPAYGEKVQEIAAEDDTARFALIDLTGGNVPELVAEHYGYDVSVFSWADGEIVTIMDQWPYRAGGNQGYEYIPGNNVIRNYDMDQAGAIVYESYMTVNDAFEIVGLNDKELCIWNYRDVNGNGWPDEGEYSDEPVYYYGDTEVSKEEYESHQAVGEFQWIEGSLSAEEILAQLSGNDVNPGSASNDTVTEYYYEPIENYRGLDGFYAGSGEQSTLSFSVYTSQEEGEIEIGGADIYVNGGLHYSGGVVPIAENIYKVMTDTEEEVLLVEAASEEIAVLQLYVDGQYLEEYWMQEHYEH